MGFLCKKIWDLLKNGNGTCENAVRDSRRNGIELKIFGLERMRYIALLGQYTHFLVHLYYLIMIIILTLPLAMIMILILTLKSSLLCAAKSSLLCRALKSSPLVTGVRVAHSLPG